MCGFQSPILVTRWVTVFLFLFLLTSSAGATGQRVLLNIASYHEAYEWTRFCSEGIASALPSSYELQQHFMDTKRIGEEHFADAAEQAWQRYRETQADLVLLGDDNALKLLGPRLAAEGIPVVFYGINANPRSYFPGQRIPRQFTGILERSPLHSTMALIKQVIPAAKEIVILVDVSATSTGVLATGVDEQGRVDITGMRSTIAQYQTFSEWKENVRGFHEQYDAIILSTFFTLQGENGKVVPHMEVLEWTSSHAQIPVFGSLNFMTGDRGALGAMVVDSFRHGQQAGEFAVTILETNSTPAVIADSGGKLYFNKKQLQRFKLKLGDELKKSIVFQ